MCTSGNVQGLDLALHTGTTPGSAKGTIRDTGDQSRLAASKQEPYPLHYPSESCVPFWSAILDVSILYSSSHLLIFVNCKKL